MRPSERDELIGEQSSSVFATTMLLGAIGTALLVRVAQAAGTPQGGLAILAIGALALVVVAAFKRDARD